MFDAILDGTVEAVRRYECGSCHRSYTRNTMGLLRLSRPGADAWSEFVEPALRGEPLSACAEECGVPKPTAHYMRLRPCQAMERAAPALSCGRGDGCRVDGKHLDESPAGLGMGSARGGPRMPRDAHRTGGDARGRGISNDKVCVIRGVADDGSEFARLCDRGRPTDQSVREPLEGRVGRGSVAGTDGPGAYGRVLPALGVGSHLVFPSDGSAGDGPCRADAMHSRLVSSLSGFNGVSTRYLQFYLQWFVFEEYVRRACRDMPEATTHAVARGTYALTRRNIDSSGRPFWDFWEGKVPVVDTFSLYGVEA